MHANTKLLNLNEPKLLNDSNFCIFNRIVKIKVFMLRFNFNSLPVNTLIGSRWQNFNEIVKGRVVDEEYKNQFNRVRTICRLISLLQPLEDKQYRKKVEGMEMKEDPLFIIGHWRSGTTFVHNVLSCDKHFGYNTTYQTVFPNIVLCGQPFFKSIVNLIMPDKRPVDNMVLAVDKPQEEEFALANIMPFNFYNFWFFPRDTMEYCDRYLLFENISVDELNVFEKEFVRLIKTSLFNTGGKQFLSKNPPHTGRIPQLLKMFPNAKFIYIMRNPYTVFESTRNFFTKIIKSLKFQDITTEEIETNILEIYRKLFLKYEKDKVLIPEGNLVELKFEDFENEPFNQTRMLYERLNFSDFSKAESSIRSYIDSMKSYRKNRYEYAPETITKVNKHWHFALEKWGY